MFRFTMIHVEIITPCAVEITQYALKGQKLLAQGTPWVIMDANLSP